MRMDEVLAALQQLAPLEIAEEWDNVGLLIGWTNANVQRIMTTLDVVDSTLDEAIAKQVDLIVTHHPLPFKATKRITDADTPGRLICSALQSGISIYSPHTAWDNTFGGINDQLADAIGLDEVTALSSNRTPTSGLSSTVRVAGSGRVGVGRFPYRLHQSSSGLRA